jgi:hypothetical protein
MRSFEILETYAKGNYLWILPPNQRVDSSKEKKIWESMRKSRKYFLNYIISLPFHYT